MPFAAPLNAGVRHLNAIPQQRDGKVMNRFAPYILVLLLFCQVAAQEVRTIPPKEDYLRDDVGLLDREQRRVIIGLLEKQSQKSLGRIYLDILDKLPPDLTIEQYARKRLNEQPRMPN